MGITRLTGFTAQAEILGALREVVFKEGAGMMLAGLTLQDAYAILDKLTLGTLVSIKPGGEQTAPAHSEGRQEAQMPAPAVAAPKADSKPKVEKVAPQKPKEEVKEPPKMDAKKELEVAVAKAEVAGKVVEEQTKTAKEKLHEAIVKDDAKAAPVAEPAKPAQASAGIAEELIHATKLLMVLNHLQDKGFKGLEALTAECERLKPDVPLLSRIPNMKDRVGRTLEAMGNTDA
jgi:hypothetical protein